MGKKKVNKGKDTNEEENKTNTHLPNIPKLRNDEDTLQNFLALSEATLNSIHNGILAVDKDGKVIKANTEFAKMWQIPEDVLNSGDDNKLLNYALEQLAEPDEFIAKVKELYNSPEAESFDLIHFKDGRVFERISKPMRIDDEMKGRVWSFLDITEQKRQDEEIRRAKQRIEMLMTSSTIMLYSSEAFGDFDATYISDNISSITGYSKEEFLSKGFWISHIHPEDAPTDFENIKMLLENDFYKYEYRFLFKDGTYHWMYDELKLVRDSSGNPIEILGTWSDITERKNAEKAVKESEERLNDAQAIAKVGSWETDLSNLEVKWSDETFRIFELDPKGFYATHPNFLEYVHPEDRAKVDEAFTASLNTHSHNSIQHRIITPGGKVKFVEENWKIFYNNQEKPIRALGTCSDITMRKQSEEEIKEYAEQYSLMKSTDLFGYFLVDESGKLLDVNDYYCDLSGYTKEELINLTIPDLEVIEKPEDIARRIQRIIENGKEHFEGKHKAKDGSTFDVEISTVYWHSKRKFIVFIRDITLRKQAENELLESIEKYRTLAESSPEMVYMINKEGYVEYVNSLAAEKFHSTPEKIIGRNLKDIYPQNIADEHIEVINKVFESKKIFKEEITEDIPTGKVWIDVTLSPVINKNNEVVSVLGISNDITIRKKYEEEIIRSNENLIKLNAEKDKFFSIIAHDLRSPFQSFLGFTEIMKEGISNMSPKDLQKMANLLNKSANNLFQLLTNLLEWAMVQRGLTSINPIKLSLKKIAEDVAETFKTSALKKEIEIKIDIAEDVFATADESMLKTILRNLISNALKFTNKGGQVTILANRFEDNISIKVKDTGIGMSNEMINDLFKLENKTYRKGTEKEPSTGLGLVLCKEFTEKHKGKLWVVSEEGKGSEFIVILPS